MSSPAAPARFSVIIPAHNEAKVIDRCLDTLLSGLAADAEVLVCCNGCTDDTELIASGYGPPVKVIDVPVASKPAALNAGDAAASGKVKVYLDADILLRGADLMRVVERLESGPELVAAPRLQVDARYASWPVRRYYSVWTRLPYVTHHMVGSGIYALSPLGRQRFDAFADIVGDDAFVRRLFAPEERASVAGATFVVTPPSTIRSLVNIETRRRGADDEARNAISRPAVSADGPSQTRALMRLAVNPLRWLDMAIYVYVKSASRLRYAARRLGGRHREWSRDDSSRESSPLA